MPRWRPSFGHRAAAGFFRCQRARVWTQLTISVKFAPVESGRCTNSPTSPSTLLGDFGLWSQPATGRYCAFSRKRSFEEMHVKDSFPDSFDTPWNEPPRKMMHTSSAHDENNRGWSSEIRESRRQENSLSYCDADSGAQTSAIESCWHSETQGRDKNDVEFKVAEPEVIRLVQEGWITLPESGASNLPSDPNIDANIWMQPAVSPSLVFAVSVDSVHDFTADPKYQLSEVCPPFSDPPQFQSSHLASATCTAGSMDQNGVLIQKSMLVQASLPSLAASLDPLLFIPSNSLPNKRLTGKLAADVSFPTAAWEEFAQSPMKYSGVEEGISDRAVTSVTGISLSYNSTTCSHRKKRRQEARLRAKTKVVAHSVKLIVKDDEDKPTPLERERRKASSREDISSLKLPPPYKQHGGLEAIEEGEEATTDDERLRIPRLSTLDEGGRNNSTFDKSVRKGYKASFLRIAESFLFGKVLTKTDTNGLGRIILPKKPAEQFLPYVPCKEGIEMEFEDCNGKVWKGRLRYWVNKSKMYVIEGVGGFLREHKLALGDKILLCSSGSDKRLLFRYERGPFVPQTPCNVATPLGPATPSHDPPTLPPSRHILPPIPNTPIPNPSSVPPLPETFFSSSTTFSSKLYPGLPRNTPYSSSTSTIRAPSPLFPSPLPRTHSLAPPSPKSPKPKLASWRPSPLPFVPASKPGLQPAPFTPHPPNSIPPTIPFASTKTGYSGGRLDLDPREKESIHSFHNPHSLLPSTTSTTPLDPPTDILSDSGPLTTASELDRLPRVRMKSGRLVPPLVVVALLQSARQLQRRRVKDAPGGMQPLPSAGPLKQGHKTAYGVEGVEGVVGLKGGKGEEGVEWGEGGVGGEGDEGLVRYVVPSYESNDLDFGTSYSSRIKMEVLQKGVSPKMEDDKVGMSLEGLLETLKCWDKGSRSIIPDIDEGGGSMAQEWGGMIGEMTRTVFPNVHVEEVGVCDVMLRAHYEEHAVGDMGIDSQILRHNIGVGGEMGLGDNEICPFERAPLSYGMIENFNGGLVETSDDHSEDSKCSTLDSSCSLDLATTESCLQLFGRFRSA